MENKIKESLKNFFLSQYNLSENEIQKFEVFHPDNLDFGDFTTNIALVMSKKVEKNPRELAEEILNFLNQNDFQKIEVAGPGYLNFYLSKKFFYNFLKNSLKENKQKQIKILFEHSSPNLFKPFHIGHLVNNSLGEALSRVLKYQGAELKIVSFPSDVSTGIAKTI